MATTKQWMRFFLDAGIPPDSAAHYAVTFEQNRMGLDMVGDLDKEYLRDLKITALGDIISILRAAKKHQDRTEREAAVAKREQELHKRDDSPLLKREKRNPSPPSKPTERSPSPITYKEDLKILREESERAARIREELERTARVEKELQRARTKRASEEKAREPEVRRVSTVEKIKTEVEPVVKVKTEGKSATVNKAPESKSVFSRLGATEQAGSSSRLKVETDDVKQEVKGVFGRLGKQEEAVAKVKEQEPRVTSTSEEKTQEDLRSARASASPGRGILKKRAAGDVGTAIPRSKSASNIISLKAPVKEKQTKRISFGETETRTMAPREDIRSRLGYGRQASPPPELEEGGDSVMQTQIQKIALGGGKFEMRKVMKMVKTELGRPSPERTKETDQRVTLTTSKSALRKPSTSPIPSPSSSRMSAAGAFAAESRMSKEGEEGRKLKISVINDVTGVTAGKRSISEDNEMVKKPRKRLAMYRTLPDGTVEKEYISYDDPILAKVPIQKREEVEKEVVIVKDKTASNFKVVRRTSQSNEQGKSLTLAEKAREMRSREEEVDVKANRAKRFETLASRAQRKRSPSPEAARPRDERERSPQRKAGGPVFARLGPRF